MRFSGRVVAGTAVGVLVAGAMISGWVGDDSATSTAPGSVPPIAPPPGASTAGPSAAGSPSTTRPVGQEIGEIVEAANTVDRSEAGARTAAVAYLEATEEAVRMSPTEAAAMQRAFATADFAEEFGSDTEQRMIDLTAAVPNGIVLRVAPIEARSSSDGDDWLVAVWYVQAITIAEESVVDDWRTAHYRLRWEDDTWRIAEFSSERGPMPGRGTNPPSASPQQFEATLTDFTDEGL